MRPLYKLKETRLEEDHKQWVGREVMDRYGRHLGHVKEILIEERTLEDALREDRDPRGWTAKADFVVVNVETGVLGRLHARHVVMLPISAIRERNGMLATDEDGDEIRVALAS
jgi:hypothetical protein